MGKKNMRKYEAHVIVSIPLGAYYVTRPMEALDKLMRTKAFHEARKDSVFDTLRVILVETGTKKETVISIPKIPPIKEKKNV